MALTSPKATLLHAALASISPEVATIDDIIRTPTRLPPELLLIVRSQLLTALTTQLFLDSTRALAEYEVDLQRLLCSDCISYNYDIYGPDVWQWQQFSGPCACIQTTPDEPPKLTPDPQQFVNPHHWLEHHLSLQAARLSSSTSPSHALSIWDVVTDVLGRCYCEPLREELDDFTTIQGGGFPANAINPFYHHRVTDYYGSLKQSQSPPVVRIQPLPSALRLYETHGIGEVGEAGDAFRTEVILHQATRELGLTLELKDVFSSPRESLPQTLSWSPRRHDTSPDVLMSSYAVLLHPCALSALQGAIKTYSFVSTVLGAFISMPVTVATIALTVICFYSRPVALRVGL